MFRVIYPDAPFSDDAALERAEAGADCAFEVYRRGEAIAPASWAACDAVILTRLTIDAALLAQAPKCRIVVRMGVGYDTIDLAACGARGVAACNVPDYGTTEVADAAIAMMLSFARGTTCFDALLHRELAQGWRFDAAPTARRLDGAVFGVIGLGAIGTAAALRAKAFGMKVRFYDPYILPGRDRALGVTRDLALKDLLAASDVVSVHAPLSAETRGMVGAAAIAAMKPGALLINVARGPIVDTAAAVAGLRSGRLAGVGLDVLPEEPIDLADPLVAAWHADEDWIRGRVLLSPHAAYYCEASFEDQRRKAIATALHYLRDGLLLNCVNLDLLDRDNRP